MFGVGARGSLCCGPVLDDLHEGRIQRSTVAAHVDPSRQYHHDLLSGLRGVAGAGGEIGDWRAALSGGARRFDGAQRPECIEGPCGICLAYQPKSSQRDDMIIGGRFNACIDVRILKPSRRDGAKWRHRVLRHAPLATGVSAGTEVPAYCPAIPNGMSPELLAQEAKQIRTAGSVAAPASVGAPVTLMCKTH